MSQDQQPAVKPVITAKQAKRAGASVQGMLISTGICVAIFLGVFFLNPQPRAGTYHRDVDVASIAASAQEAAGYRPLSPALPAGWTSNFARWSSGTNDGVPSWEVGYLTPGGQFIQLTQTSKANSTWLSQQASQAPVTGQRTIAGTNFELRDAGKGNPYLIVTIKGSTVILGGTAQLSEFDVLGGAVVHSLKSGTAAPAG